MHRAFSRYSFVLSILWFGIAAFIAYVETPLRFQPERISLEDALSIGHLVFHALNATELFLAAALVVACLISRGARSDRVFAKRISLSLAIAVSILLVQTGMLFTVLDWRTEAILRGEEVAPSMHHQIYIGLDLIKLLAVAALAAFQIRQFELAEPPLN